MTVEGAVVSGPDDELDLVPGRDQRDTGALLSVRTRTLLRLVSHPRLVS